jgi:hypothetical protein
LGSAFFFFMRIFFFFYHLIFDGDLRLEFIELCIRIVCAEWAGI